MNEERGIEKDKGNGVLPCSAYVLDNIKFELDGNEFLIFLIANKGINTKGQIFYNGELGYVLIKNGQTMMKDEFDEILINTMLRWNLTQRQV